VAPQAAFRVAVIYSLAGLAWILTSDWAVEQLAESTGYPIKQLTHFQTIKGCVYILATGVLLYLTVRHYIRQLRTERREMQARLEGIAEQYQRLFERSPSAMFIYQPGGLQILAANDTALLLFGHSRDKLLGMTVFDLLAPEELSRAKAYSVGRPDGAQKAGVWQCLRRDGQILFIDVLTHHLDFNGRDAGICLMIDVTERLLAERTLAQYRTQLEQRVADRTAELSLANQKLRVEAEERLRVERDLRGAKAAAESANLAKSSFLANTSHEIRTPLTSILGYADLLTDSSLDTERRRQYLEVLQQNAQHLLALIDDLLDLSRAEMGKVRLTFDEHSPREIAEQAVELLRSRAQEKSLDFTLHLTDRVPAGILTDGVRLRQVLLNLLANAIKFTPAGGVSLTISGESGPTGNMALFRVSDTGIGMSRDQLEKIFEPFYQVDQGARRRYGGSGLGLTISRQLAQQLGGRLDVESIAGRGSTFTLRLPASTAPARRADLDKPSNGSALRGKILLAEDNANVRLLVHEYLKRAGAAVITASDGAQALEIVQRFLSGDRNASDRPEQAAPFDLVLLDLHMPVMDGAEAMRKMRTAGYDGPIVGLTADFSDKTAAEWARDGWDAMAAKPIDRKAFIPLLARMIDAGAARRRPRA
jgi:PAS domain S-box-containing protein